MGRDADGIWFRSASPVVFQMQPVNTLEELKSVILRNMGTVVSMLVRRVAYRLLNLFPPNQFKFKIFWVDSDAHVRSMFELHCRYGSRDVMELLTEMQTVNVDAGGSTSSFRGGPGAIIAVPIQFANPEVGDDDSDEDFVANTDESSESSDGSEFVPESQARHGFFLPAPSPIPDLSSVGSHFHTLNLDDMVEEQREGFGGGGEDYDLDEASEFWVGHRFSTVPMVTACSPVNESWILGGAEVWGTARLFGTVNVLRSRSVRRQTDLQLHPADNKGQSFRAHSGLAIRPSTELLFHAVLQEVFLGWHTGRFAGRSLPPRGPVGSRELPVRQGFLELSLLH
ncbi:hypothetical protein PIB30_062219 [Stylosanthes scabra]|uniref:Uncharacterized protein n=1 Tax=Stylosanthes scabra TaxID=79078 RepID=A0ABU6QKJ9_9FABA|nr:hypothetical protein [Stylosanthes scabra]